jgi:hypothetical protein
MAPDTTGLPRQSNALDISKDIKDEAKERIRRQVHGQESPGQFVSYSNTAAGVLDLIC